jgi:glycosyltransferase involved in cell wall biosynthesis
MSAESRLANREGEQAVEATWGWARAAPSPGFTAVVRARDEARALPWVLGPLLAAVAEVVLVDNASSDGTVEVAEKAAAAADAADRLAVRPYPFDVARCGSEHLATPPDSVHSLTYFYNYSFAQVGTAYALKWDADMVLTRRGVAALRDLAWQTEGVEAIVYAPRCPLYVASEKLAFLDTVTPNAEEWGWPNAPAYHFGKGFEWEVTLWPPKTPQITLPHFSVLELKFLDGDEFAHWSDTDFAERPRQGRKQREWEVFHALRDVVAAGADARAAGGDPVLPDGVAALPDGVVAIEAPAGVHVIEHVRDAPPGTWPLR